MKVVIEVSEKDYRDFVLQYDNGILDEKTPSHRAKIAIANGTPLPKGHGDLIDRKDLMDRCVTYLESSGATTNLIKSAMTIIEADKEGEEKG